MNRTDSSLEKAAELLRRKMTSLGPLAEVLLRDIRTLARDRVEISPGRPIVKEHERCQQLYLVESGWVFRSRGLASGRRQIVNYALPGDILCADSMLFRATGFDLTARTPVSVIRIEPPASSVEMFDRYPGLSAAISWTTGQGNQFSRSASCRLDGATALRNWRTRCANSKPGCRRSA
jgi:CRP-like cAMP-binding protein